MIFLIQVVRQESNKSKIQIIPRKIYIKFTRKTFIINTIILR